MLKHVFTTRRRKRPRYDYRVDVAIRGKTLRGIVPEELLFDELGPRNSERDRRRWLCTFQHDIVVALAHKVHRKVPVAPFDRVILKEVS